MHKILLFLFIFLWSVFSVYAENINNQNFTFWINDEINISLWPINTLTITAPYWTNDFTLSYFDDIVSWICGYWTTSWYQCSFYWNIDWVLNRFALWRSPSGPTFDSLQSPPDYSNFNIYQDNSTGLYGIPLSDYSIYYFFSDGELSIADTINFTDTWISALWQFIGYNTIPQPLWPDLVCTDETIPQTWFVNIYPTTQEEVTEIVIDPIQEVHAFWTSLSWANPLQVILEKGENVTWFTDFTYGSWALTFKTQNKSAFSDDITILNFLASEGICYIDFDSNLWIVTVQILNTSMNTESVFQNFNLADNNNRIPTWCDADIVRVYVKNELLKTYEISNIEVWSLVHDQTQQVEICYNPDEEVYTIDNGLDDPYVYDWDPYINLVWTPTPAELNFSEDWYTFFDNGFCLNNFVPFPSGWQLTFQIIDPDQNIITTYPLRETWIFKYGFNTCSKITTNYHETSGTYYVRAIYNYQWIDYFPMWENYFTYNIIAPESISNDFPIDTQVSQSCASDTWAFSWLVNFFSCSTTFFLSVATAIPNFLSWVYEFLTSFLDIWNVSQSKPWAFLFPTAYANNTPIVDGIFWQNSQINSAFTNSSWVKFIDNILLFLKVSFVFIVFVLILSLYTNNHKNENNN